MTLEEILAKIAASTKEAPYSTAKEDITALVTNSVTAVNSKNTELLGEVKELKNKVRTIPEGFDPERWNKLVNLEKEVDRSKLDSNEAVERVKADLTNSHKTEIEKLTSEIKGLNGALQKELIDNTVNSAIAESGGNSLLLLPHVRNSVKVEKTESGEYVTRIIDSAGINRYSMSPDAAGQHMTVKELIGEFKANDAFKAAFSPVSSGAGSKGSNGAGDKANPFVRGTSYNLTEQAKLRVSDKAEYDRMKADAESINAQAQAQGTAPQAATQAI